MLSTYLILTLSAQPPPGDAELISEIKSAGKRAACALIDRQNEDGGYGPQPFGASDVGITGLVVWALAASPPQYREWQGPYMSSAVDFLLKHQKDNGGIHDGTLWNYKTSIAIMALSAVDAEKYRDQIAKAVAFVKGLQLNEESRVPYDPKRHVDYGGWGYGSTRRADGSNTQFSLEAVATGGTESDDSAIYRRAQAFLSNLQNSCKTNKAITEGLVPGLGTNDDGGFIYMVGKGQGSPTRLQDGTWHHSSYGSMTYAGIKSFIYAKLDREDERLQKAYQWVCQNYTVDENPGMATKERPEAGQQGLYYYYRTMAKALLLWGEPVVPTPSGKRRWAVDLGRKLLSLQRKDGLWANEADRWMEAIPEVTTAYAILALADVAEALKTWPQPLDKATPSG